MDILLKFLFFVYYCCLIWCSTNKLFFIYSFLLGKEKKLWNLFLYEFWWERKKRRRTTTTTTTTTIDRHRINSNVLWCYIVVVVVVGIKSQKKVVKVVFYFFEFHSSPCFVKELQCVWIRMRMNERMKSSIWSNKMLRSKMI